MEEESMRMKLKDRFKLLPKILKLFKINFNWKVCESKLGKYLFLNLKFEL